MRVLSFNVNGIRAAAGKGLARYLVAQEADVICLQELRASREDVPSELSSLPDYHTLWHCSERKGYSGVALLSRQPPDQSVCGMEDEQTHSEGRLLRADFGGLSILSLYVPSGITGPVRQEHKMRFLARLLAYLSDLKARGREVLVCGDFNIAHQAIDLARPSANEHTSGYLPEERRWMDDLLAEGYVDIYRALVGPEPGHYTWWYNFKAARPKNLGWRLDYQIATPATAAQAKRATIDRSVLFSDHAPVTIDYEMNVSRPPAEQPTSAV